MLVFSWLIFKVSFSKLITEDPTHILNHNRFVKVRKKNFYYRYISSSFTVNADILHEHGSAEEQYSYVHLQNFKDSQDPELVWRFGRACYCIYTYSSATKKMKTTVIMNGLKAVERAVQLDSQNANAFVVGLSFN